LVDGILKRIKLGVGHRASLLTAGTTQLASMVPEPVRCVFGGLMWLK
jgi:hypothetical protein